MLVPTMTPEEIYAEMYKDAEWLQKEISYKVFPKYSKRARKVNSFPDLQIYSLESQKTHITYVIVFFAYNHSDWKHPYCLIYTKYTHESGKTLIYIERDRFAIRLYTSHFLQRYRERNPEHVSQCKELADIDFELYFIMRNWDVEEMSFNKTMIEESPNNPYWKGVKEQMERSRFWQDPEYDRYSVACITGMCLCERNKANKNISIFDTYISADLLKSSQGFDFLAAFSRVFINAMARKYPRQKVMIVKEWNDMLASLPGNEYEKEMDIFFSKMEDLSQRYPINALV